MATRFYFVPMVTAEDDGVIAVFRCPKYALTLSGRWQGIDYGAEDICLLVADVTPSEHTILSGQADVVSVPELTGNVIGAATVRNRVEALGLPAEWITNGTSWRVVLRRLRKIVMFAQKFRGLFKARLFEDGITLDSTVNQIPLAKRQRLADTADALGLDRSAITGSTTVRQALRILADQLPDASLLGEAV